jgi:AmiR/NasT family two-component response regulator
LNQLSRQNTCAVVALLESSDVDRSQRLMNDQVMGVLIEPVNESDLRTSIYLARRRFQQTRQMEARIDELRHKLDDDQEARENES